MPLFGSLHILDERERPQPAVWNMALDQALVEQAGVPVLRLYRWQQPAVSFGYFLPFAEAERAARGRELVRRWTGGGIVEHGDDFTWSLIVPSAHPVSRLRPVESYAKFHAAAAAAMPAEWAVTRAGAETPVPASGLCMTSPAPGDLLLGERKIAGAGQRRCRQGLLHQGSISGVQLPADFAAKLARELSSSQCEFPAELYPGELAGELVRQRYGTDEWLRRK